MGRTTHQQRLHTKRATPKLKQGGAKTKEAAPYMQKTEENTTTPSKFQTKKRFEGRIISECKSEGVRFIFIV
jgi:hypothetical protein